MALMWATSKRLFWPPVWQHHAAALGVFLVWGELMLMIGRLPTFGIYVQVYTYEFYLLPKLCQIFS